MSKPRFKRRKEQRPAEITTAAMELFAEKGYDATRVDDVAQRAGISKGLLYLYFKTKEELFKAVIRSFVIPRVDALSENIASTELSAADFLRGPFLEFARSIPKSPVRILVRLMVSEGPKHPDLTAYYLENVVSKGLDALNRIIQRGVARGEFRRTALDEFPQLLVTPVLFSVLWSTVFGAQQALDTDRLLEAHVELVLAAISTEYETEEA